MWPLAWLARDSPRLLLPRYSGLGVQILGPHYLSSHACSGQDGPEELRDSGRQD